MQQPDAFQAKRVLQIQTILGLVLAVCVLPFGDSVALSVLVGTGICLLANALLAAWVFRAYRAQDPGRLLLRFYVAEAAKIALVVSLCAVAYVTLDRLNVPALLGAYFVVQVIPTLIAAQPGSRTTKR